MKTITKFLLIFLFVFGIRVNAQITLRHTFSGEGSNQFQWVYLRYSGFKYVYLHQDTLTFYNLNYSLFRNAIFPDSLLANLATITFISEGLFDLDSSHIDYLISFNYDYNYAIYKDDGTLLFDEDSARINWSFTGMGAPIFSPIFESDSGTFMLVERQGSPYPYGEEIYQLPGSFPCIPGCGSLATDMPVINGKNGVSMNVYPNPTNNYSTIYYTLPLGTTQGEIIIYDIAGRVVKRYTVTSQFDHLRLTTSDIAAGTYFYQLSANGNNISTKKIVVVK